MAVVDPTDVELRKVDRPHFLNESFSSHMVSMLYICEEVIKLSRNLRPSKRIWMVAPGVTYLCEPTGIVTRMMQLHDIEKVFLQDTGNGKSRILIKARPAAAEPTQILEIGNHRNPMQLIKILNLLCRAQTDQDLPFESIPSTVDLRHDPDKFGSLNKDSIFGYATPSQKKVRWETDKPVSPRKKNEIRWETERKAGDKEKERKAQEERREEEKRKEMEKEEEALRNASANTLPQPDSPASPGSPGSPLFMTDASNDGTPLGDSVSALQAPPAMIPNNRHQLELKIERDKRIEAEKNAWKAETAANTLAEQLARSEGVRLPMLMITDACTEGVEVGTRACDNCAMPNTPFCAVTGVPHPPDDVILTAFTSRLTQHCQGTVDAKNTIRYDVSAWRHFPVRLDKEVLFSVVSADRLLGKAGVLLRDLLPANCEVSPEVLWNVGVPVRLDGRKVGMLKIKAMGKEEPPTYEDAATLYEVIAGPHHSMHKLPGGAPVNTVSRGDVVLVEETAYHGKELWGRVGGYWALIKDSRGTLHMARVGMNRDQLTSACVVAALVAVYRGYDITAGLPNDMSCTRGLNEVQRQLEHLEKDLSKMMGTRQVPPGLLPPSFASPASLTPSPQRSHPLLQHSHKVLDTYNTLTYSSPSPFSDYHDKGNLPVFAKSPSASTPLSSNADNATGRIYVTVSFQSPSPNGSLHGHYGPSAQNGHSPSFRL